MRFVVALAVCRLFAEQTADWKEIELHYERAQAALRSGQAELAAHEFKEILRIQPGNAQAHANLGVIAFNRRDYAAASQELRAALKIEPALTNATAFLGMCELRSGQREDARKLLESSFARLKDPDLKTRAGMDLVSLDYESGNLNHAIEVLRELEPLKQAKSDVLYAEYRAYSDLAAKALALLAEAAPDSAAMHRILAQNLASRDDFNAAIAEYRRSIGLDPQLPGAHFELGELILAAANDDSSRADAEREFQQELAANPQNARCHYLVGVLAWQRSQPEKALQHWLAALKIQPDFVDAHIAAGKALNAAGESNEALAHLEQAVRIDPQNEVAHYRLAQIYRQLGRTADSDRESSLFQNLRDSQKPLRALYQQTLLHESIDGAAQP